MDYSSAWAKHKAMHKIAMFFNDCHYCKDASNRVKSDWRWLKQQPAGSYRNTGKRRGFNSPAKG